jgi:hypothetical protein
MQFDASASQNALEHWWTYVYTGNEEQQWDDEVPWPTTIYCYPSAGVYKVRLITTNQSSASAEDIETITVG